MAATKEGIKCDESLIIKANRDAKVQTNRKNDIDIAHFVASSICRTFLRQANSDEKVLSWVAKTYQKMNKMLDNENVMPAEIAKVGAETMRMITAFQEGNGRI